MTEKYGKGYITYYERSQGGFRIMDSETNELNDVFTLPYDRRRFYVLKGYGDNDKGLTKFSKDLKVFCEELQSEKNKIWKIKYLTLYSAHKFGVLYTFTNMAKGKYEHFEPLKNIEIDLEKKCYNAGLMYCNAGVYDTFGYDYKMCYPLIMASEKFKFPTKSGKLKTITKLKEKEKLKFGYYHVKITSDHPNVKKVFSFSKHSWYVSESLKFAMTYKDMFNFKIELIETENNAYIYKSKDLVAGKEVFGYWFSKMEGLKKLFPKNKLVKHLASSLWGHLTEDNTRNVTYEQIQQENLDVGVDPSQHYEIIEHITLGEHKDYYIIRDNRKKREYNFRLRAFITACCRIATANVVMQDIDNVIRVHTDGIAFKKKQTFNIPYLVEEEKTTGKIEWTNVNSYQRID